MLFYEVYEQTTCRCKKIRRFLRVIIFNGLTLDKKKEDRKNGLHFIEIIF